MIRDLVKKSRSYMVFNESYKLKRNDLVELIELARFSSCGKNGQYLRFITVYKEDILKEIYPYLTLDTYLKDWNGPTEGERPTGIIFIVSKECTLTDPILSGDYLIHIALAIGKPAHKVIIEDDKTHHVPNIIINDLIID